MEKKTSYVAPQIATLQIDAEETMINNASRVDQNGIIVVDPSGITKGDAGKAASKIQINDVWE